jgi:hypothetical protein
MRENAQMIELADFSPGIFSEYDGSGVGISETQEGNIVGVNGAATIDETARCTSDGTGALVPLPKLVLGKASNIKPTADNDSGNFLSGVHANFLMDGYVRGDMFVFGDQAAADGDERAGVYTMYGFPYEVGSEGTEYWTVLAQLHRMFDSSTAQHDLMWGKCTTSMAAFTASTVQLGAGNFTPFRVRNSVEDATTIDAVAWVAYGAPGYQSGGSAWKTGTLTATDLTLTDYDTYTNSTYPGSHGRIIGIFPNPTDVNGTDSGFLGGTHGGTADPALTDAIHVVSHQGRLVSVTRSLKQTGELTGGSEEWGIVSESVAYSPIQDFYGELGFGCFETAQFGEEKPFRTGTVASITADEIIFIKDAEGAILVRGDMDNPTVVQLPYVESTHGAYSVPAKSNFGLVYGTSNGVYVWEGGESSRKLSDQLEGWFWNHDTTLTYLGNRGRFGWWNPWVVVPNNFVYDSRTQGWWRLDTPANTNVALSAASINSVTNTLYAFPYKLDGDASPMWYTATPDVLADTYTWQSQPLVESRTRVITVQEIHLMVTPESNDAGSVAITLNGYDADGVAVTPVTTTFTLNANTNTQMLHKDVVTNFQATHVQVKIVADANDTSTPAPKVHKVSLATAQRARIGKS